MSKRTKPRLKGPALRVAIAKDVIADLDAKRIVAMAGAYLQSDSLENHLATPDAQATPETLGTCTVCAMGAVLVETIKRCNSVTVSAVLDMDGGKKIAEYTNKSAGFTLRQMRLMEAAFEQGAIGDAVLLPTEESDAVDFGFAARRASRSKKQSRDEKVLRAIMRNVIANNGTFKPGKVSRG